MRTKIGKFDFLTADFRLKEKFEINASDLSTDSVPKIKDVVKFPNTHINGVYDFGNFEIIVADHDWDANIYIQNNQGIFITNMLLTVVSLHFRILHLEKTVTELDKQVYVKELAKLRVLSQLEDAKNQFHKLVEINIITATIVTDFIGYDNGYIIGNSSPFIAVFDVLEELEYPIEGVNLYSIVGSYSDDVLRLLNDQVQRQSNYIDLSPGCAGRLNPAAAQLYVNTDILKFLVNYRHVLSSCADLVLNLTINKTSYSSEELFSRGLFLKNILTDFSTRFPLLKDDISVNEMISNFSDLFFSVYNERINQVTIDDLSSYELLESNTSVIKLSSLNIVLYMCIATSISYNNGVLYLSFRDGKFIHIKDFDDGLKALFNIKDHLKKVKDIILVLTSMVMLGLKINSSVSQNFFVNFDRLIPKLCANCKLEP